MQSTDVGAVDSQRVNQRVHRVYTLAGHVQHDLTRFPEPWGDTCGTWTFQGATSLLP
jgi:hypothetical protein